MEDLKNKFEFYCKYLKNKLDDIQVINLLEYENLMIDIYDVSKDPSLVKERTTDNITAKKYVAQCEKNIDIIKYNTIDKFDDIIRIVTDLRNLLV